MLNLNEWQHHFELKTKVSHVSGSSNATKCYGDLGCLHLNDDWFGLNRPVNVLPLDRHIINTRFLLTTRESTGLFQQPRFLNLSQPLSITTSPFKGTRPTKIIIHGFIDTGFVPWISVSGRSKTRLILFWTFLITYLRIHPWLTFLKKFHK